MIQKIAKFQVSHRKKVEFVNMDSMEGVCFDVSVECMKCSAKVFKKDGKDIRHIYGTPDCVMHNNESHDYQSVPSGSALTSILPSFAFAKWTDLKWIKTYSWTGSPTATQPNPDKKDK